MQLVIHTDIASWHMSAAVVVVVLGSSADADDDDDDDGGGGGGGGGAAAAAAAAVAGLIFQPFTESDLSPADGNRPAVLKLLIQASWSRHT